MGALRKGFNRDEIRERCKEVYDASGGNADLDLCGLCRGGCFKSAERPASEHLGVPVDLELLPFPSDATRLAQIEQRLAQLER